MRFVKLYIFVGVMAELSKSDCGFSDECIKFNERIKRNLNDNIRAKTFKEVTVYRDSVKIFLESSWPRYVYKIC